MGLFAGFRFVPGFEGGGCVEGVVDDDEVVVASCGEGEGVFAVFVLGDVDFVGGFCDVESAQGPGDVSGVSLSLSPAIFMPGSVSASAARMVSPSSCSMSAQVALSGTKADALVLSHVGDD